MFGAVTFGGGILGSMLVRKIGRTGGIATALLNDPRRGVLTSEDDASLLEISEPEIILRNTGAVTNLNANDTKDTILL